MRLNVFAIRRERLAEKNRRAALAGRASSGHLSAGERDRFFRNRQRAGRR